jgi:hypothetical protein
MAISIDLTYVMEETKDYRKGFRYKTSDRKGFNEERPYDRA